MGQQKQKQKQKQKQRQRQQEQQRPPPPLFFLLSVVFLFCFLISIGRSDAQQEYENNDQDDCYGTNGSSTLGYSCSGGGSSSGSCTAYLTFRAAAPSYQSPADISSLLSADAANVSSANGGVAASSPLPDGRPVLVPVTCACAGAYYQHNATYTLSSTSETYLIVANGTFEGLSTCQALIAQNPGHESHNLSVGLTIAVPLRCACPSANQTAQGYKYLLTYVVTWGDDPSAIAGRFGVDPQSLLDANTLSAGSTIYPFTTLLVPLKSEPTDQQLLAVSPPPPPSSTPPPPPPSPPPGSNSSSSNKWVFIGIGIGAGLLLLCGVLAGLLLVRRRRRRAAGLPPVYKKGRTDSESGPEGDASGKRSAPLISSDVRNVIESLAVYEHGELERATGGFGEGYRIKGSVYRGVINGDVAAIKRLKGDVSNEINILKRVNHSNVVRLSGFCVHDGDTFLVYEFADRGSLADWLHHHPQSPQDGSSNEWSSAGSGHLSWKQRVQIAHDVAEGINYLHNYTNPPYVHKNLKSSNVLLDAELRAKLSNFGLAREVMPAEESGESAPQMTRHVVGTQGYMAPEYVEHGLVTPQLDVFAFGVVMLELLSGREAVSFPDKDDDESKGGNKALLLWESISGVLGGEDARRNFRGFVDPYLQSDYPFELAFAMAELAMRCVSRVPGARPSIGEVLVSLSAIYNATSDWDPSDYSHSGSMIHAR